MKKVLFVFLVVSLLLPPAAVTGAMSDDLTSTASLFDVGTGARPLGMGGAFVGLADDSNALFYNPAGLARLSGPELNSFYSNQYGAYSSGSLSFSVKNFGISYLQISARDIIKRDLYGNRIGEFDYRSRGLIGACAESFGRLALGVQGKSFFPGFARTSSGFGFSPGLVYEMRPFRLGAVVKNLVSTEIPYDENYSESWAREAIVGIACSGEWFNLDLDMKAELTEAGIRPDLARVGAEILLSDYFTVRAGVTSEIRSSVGFSLNLGDLRLDYTYLIHGDLGSSQKFEIMARLKDFPKER